MTFNANNGRVTITFTEAIDIGSFMVEGIILKNAMGAGAISQFQLASGLETTTNSSVVAIQLSEADLLAIKSMPNLARDTSSTVFSFASSTVTDISGNALAEGEVTVIMYVPDTTSPQLSSWDIDLSNGNITLHFNEPVIVSSVEPSAITIQNRLSFPDEMVRLTGGRITASTAESMDIQIYLTTENINGIYQQLDLCTEPDNCFIAITDQTADDIFSNPNEAIPEESALNVTNFTADTFPPELVTFLELDFTNATLTLSFSETINTSSLDPTGLSLHNTYSSSLPFGTFISYTLTGGSTNSAIGSSITIDLTEDDLNQLKALQRSGLSGLCSAAATCFVRINSNLIQDVSGNPVQVLTESPIPTVDGLLRAFRSDTIQPNLANFSIDLTNGILSLTFDETIDYMSFRSEFISIQGAFDASVSISIDPVERRLITTTYGLVIDFRLSEDDILNLKSDNTIATDLNDTYIIFRREMVNDIAGNAVVERQNGISSLQASNYTEDTIQPQVSQFTQLDMNTGSLRITFSEPILPENVVFSGITLQSTVNGGNAVTLTGGTATSFNAQSTTLSIQLSRDDLRDIKILGDLGRSVLQ